MVLLQFLIPINPLLIPESIVRRRRFLLWISNWLDTYEVNRRFEKFKRLNIYILVYCTLHYFKLNFTEIVKLLHTRRKDDFVDWKRPNFA